MRFIMITTQNNEDVAVNTSNITSIQRMNGGVWILLGGDTPVSTKFTNIQSAIDYIQRAPSVSLGVEQ